MGSEDHTVSVHILQGAVASCHILVKGDALEGALLFTGLLTVVQVNVVQGLGVIAGHIVTFDGSQELAFLLWFFG